MDLAKRLDFQLFVETSTSGVLRCLQQAACGLNSSLDNLMFLSTSPSVKELILQVLTKRGALPASKILAQLSTKGRMYTLQAVYKELAHLRECGVVLKVRDRFGIALPWAISVLDFSDRLYQGCFERNGAFCVPPDAGQKQSWKFHDVRRSDAIWMQLVLSSLRASQPTEIYQWLPHPWHQLIYKSRSTQFEDALRHLGARDFVIVGGNTCLDRNAIESWPRDVFVWSTARGPFEDNRTDCLTLVNDCIITSSYPLKFANQVDRYFCRIKSIDQVDAREVSLLFEDKIQVTVKIERSQQKAGILRRKFSRYFGQKLERGASA